MAESLWNKVRVGVLGKLHSLLDDVVKTPEAYKQRIRDLESALADLNSAKYEATGSVTGYDRDILRLESENAKRQADIDLLLGDGDPSNDDAALQLQLDMEDDVAQLETLQSLRTTAQNNQAQIQQAVDQLERKRREMVSDLREMTLLTAATSAQTRAASAVEAAVGASESAAGASVDSIKNQIQHDRDVAQARFDDVFGKLESTTSPAEAAKLARAKAALAARQAAISGQAVSNVEASAPTPVPPAPAPASAGAPS